MLGFSTTDLPLASDSRSQVKFDMRKWLKGSFSRWKLILLQEITSNLVHSVCMFGTSLVRVSVPLTSGSRSQVKFDYMKKWLKVLFLGGYYRKFTLNLVENVCILWALFVSISVPLTSGSRSHVKFEYMRKWLKVLS